jgi:hypothetical protein
MRTAQAKAGRGPGPRTARTRALILGSADRMWRSEDLPGPRSTAQHLLTELTRAGELRRVRKGLYWRGRRTPLGMSPPPPDAVISELAPGRGVGPAGLSASHMLRLSTQVPRRSQVAVPTRAPRNAGSVTFVSRAARTGRRSAALNASEVALLETLDGWTRVIEVPLPEAWDRLQGLLEDDPSVRPERLARAARTEPGPVRSRLAALLVRSGFVELADTIPEADPRTEKATRRAVGLIGA